MKTNSDLRSPGQEHDDIEGDDDGKEKASSSSPGILTRLESSTGKRDSQRPRTRGDWRVGD